MKLRPWAIGLILLLALGAGALGAALHSRWATAVDQPGLHPFVHNELDLSFDQERALAQLDAQYRPRRRALDLAMRSANGELAAAIEAEHRYGPKVAQAIERVHAVMGDRQKATVGHVFAMRAILDSQQQSDFDRRVSDALTHGRSSKGETK